MAACCCRLLAPSTVPDFPQKVSKNPLPLPIGVPKPILNAHNTQATRTSENATNVSIMLLTDQRFCITPPYSTARPGRLISPTSVAAVSCHALSPGVSHCGYALQDMCLHFPTVVESPRTQCTHASRARRLQAYEIGGAT